MADKTKFTIKCPGGHTPDEAEISFGRLLDTPSRQEPGSVSFVPAKRESYELCVTLKCSACEAAFGGPGTWRLVLQSGRPGIYGPGTDAPIATWYQAQEGKK